MIVQLKDLKPNPHNKKIYDNTSLDFAQGIEDLKKSIDKVGLLEPLVVNKKKTILSGHRRFRALTELGIKKCEVRVEDYDNELLGLIEHNKYRKKTDLEILEESKILERELKKFVKRGRPFKGKVVEKRNVSSEVSKQLNIPASSLRKLKVIGQNNPQLLEKIGKELTREQAYQKSKKKKSDRVDVELEEIKLHDKKLYKEVVSGKVKRKDAHNRVMASVNMVSEFKGKGTQTKKIGLQKEMRMLEKRYKVKLDDWCEALKELYPYTFESRIKDK